MTLLKNTIIFPMGDVRKFHMPDVDEDKLEAFQTAVQGWIETVEIPTHPDYIALVNEEGLMRDLDHNMSASILLNRPIKGNCLILAQEDFV